MIVSVREFRRVERGTLLGFATIEMAGGIVVCDVTLHESHGRRWAHPPGRPEIDKAGGLVRDARGRIQYAAVLGFVDNDVRREWSDAVCRAVSAHLGQHRDALELRG